MGPPKRASRATTPPIAIAAVMPFSFAPVDTLKITKTRKKVMRTSRMNDWVMVPLGWVAPRPVLSGKSSRTVRLADIAAMHWVAM